MKNSGSFRKQSRFMSSLVLAIAGTTAFAQEKLPVYEVAGPLVTPNSGKSLAKNLSVEGMVDASSIFSYYPAKSPLVIPQKKLTTGIQESEDRGVREDYALDLAGLNRLVSVPRATAQRQVTRALSLAGIRLQEAKPMVSESRLEIRDPKGKPLASKNLETVVSYQMSLGGIPAVGPGFKARFAFAPSGSLSQAYVFGRQLKKGPEVPLMSKSEALQMAMASFGTKNTKLTARVVYFLPGPDVEAKRIFPHYEIGGTMQLGKEVIKLRPMFIPAAKGYLQASVSANSRGGSVSGKVSIRGGRKPYTVQWDSSTTDLGKAAFNESGVQYQVKNRFGTETTNETLKAVVTDADGLRVTTSSSLKVVTLFDYSPEALFASLAPTPRAKKPGRYDGAIEYIDWATNASNCRSEMNNRGLPVQFYWGENNAWEQDFKKESAGGDDSNWVDDVDVTFYTGHANGDGFVFKSNHDDTFLHYNDASWGEREAEWIVIAACGPLQPTEGGRGLDRWVPAFRGLHILMGYGNISYDSNEEGRKFMNRILRNSNPTKVRDAWISTASEEQPSDVLMGLMGVVRDDWAWNWDDYFWGKGPVGPDIPANRVIAYWYYVVPC